MRGIFRLATRSFRLFSLTSDNHLTPTLPTAFPQPISSYLPPYRHLQQRWRKPTKVFRCKFCGTESSPETAHYHHHQLHKMGFYRDDGAVATEWEPIAARIKRFEAMGEKERHEKVKEALADEKKREEVKDEQAKQEEAEKKAAERKRKKKEQKKKKKKKETGK